MNSPTTSSDVPINRGRAYNAKQVAYMLVVVTMYVAANLMYGGGQSFYDTNIDHGYRDQIDAEKSDIVLVGNSMLGQNVNADLLAELTGANVAKFNVPGSASAVWYLIIKNQVITAEHKPTDVMIFFRDRFICDPYFATTGHDIRFMDRFAGPDEVLLQELTYNNRIHGEGFLEELYLPLYANRERIKQTYIDRVKHWPARFFLGASRTEADVAVDSAFADDNFDAERLSEFQIDTAAAPQAYAVPFEEQVENSYLPEMIRLTRENGIRLHLVRVKNLLHAKGQVESERITKFIQDLAAYAEANDVPFVDYSGEETLTLDLFAIGDHLSYPEGANVFTRLLVRDLGSELQYHEIESK